jgi:hypothetical protein
LFLSGLEPGADLGGGAFAYGLIEPGGSEVVVGVEAGVIELGGGDGSYAVDGGEVIGRTGFGLGNCGLGLGGGPGSRGWDWALRGGLSFAEPGGLARPALGQRVGSTGCRQRCRCAYSEGLPASDQYEFAGLVIVGVFDGREAELRGCLVDL